MSARNMVAMFGAMAMLRRIDQEEPLVLLYARVGYLLYVAVTSLLYILLHFRIVAIRDMTLITVPLVQKAPSFSEAMEKARKAAEKAEVEKRGESIDDDESTTTTTTTTDKDEGEGEEEEKSESSSGENKTETITVMEYDLRHLASARRSWATSSCFLAAVHYQMQSVSPLAMAAIMGIIRLLTEEPLVQIHLRGVPAVDKLARPFTAEKNPLATMLKDMTPKEDESGTASSTTSTTTTTGGVTTTPGRIQNGQATNNSSSNNVDDDLHDDGDDDDDDDDDDKPVVSTNIRDDHIKSDFDDDDTPAEELSEEAKKAQ